METETVLPGNPRTPAEGEAYTSALAAFDEAQATLAAMPTETLLRSAYHLTHRMHAIELEPFGNRSPVLRDLRQQRDMIDAEIMRRADGINLRRVTR